MTSGIIRLIRKRLLRMTKVVILCMQAHPARHMADPKVGTADRSMADQCGFRAGPPFHGGMPCA